MATCPSCGNPVPGGIAQPCPTCGAAVGALDLPPPPVAPSPQTSKSSTAGKVGRAIGGVLAFRIGIAVVVLLGGSIWAFFNNAKRDDAGQITDAGNVQANQLAVGDCVDWPGNSDTETEFESLKALPCTEGHDVEVFANVTYPGTSDVFPGTDAINAWADTACLAAFEPYVGRSYEEATELGLTYFTPTEGSWRQDDRTVNCVIARLDEGKLVGSVKGT